jgi:hypothetical protein
MARDLDRYRKGTNGSLYHDGDCFFWDIKVCTCGLLHNLKCQDEPEKLYPLFYNEVVAQRHHIHLSKRRLEVLEEIRTTCDHCMEIADKAIEDRPSVTPNELCRLMHQVGLDLSLWFVASLSKEQLKEAYDWAYYEWVDQTWDLPSTPKPISMPDFLAKA